MKRYSKPLGNLLDFKQDFFTKNDAILSDAKRIIHTYLAQPKRSKCKNCNTKLSFSPSTCFEKLGIKFCICTQCGHCNGLHEETEAFCRSLYSDDEGDNYAQLYSAEDIQRYKKRVSEIYLPKAEFLKEALEELGVNTGKLADFGAGAGYFLSAATQSGFVDTIGYEPSQRLVAIGNAMMGDEKLINVDMANIVEIISKCDATTVSFIGVLEHVLAPRTVLQSLSTNEKIKYIYLSVPLFSPTVIFECIWENIIPRQLAGAHTHLYTERSVQHFCEEFGFKRASEWWFGLDAFDLFRSVNLTLSKTNNKNSFLQTYWEESFFPLLDKLQSTLDEAKACSEVHMLLKKD